MMAKIPEMVVYAKTLGVCNRIMSSNNIPDKIHMVPRETIPDFKKAAVKTGSSYISAMDTIRNKIPAYDLFSSLFIRPVYLLKNALERQGM